MDDFNINSLNESKNEWVARLLNTLTPLIIEGFKSIFDESVQICRKNKEMDKYLMTFQNLIVRIPNWNPNIIEEEKKRIIKRSNINYLEDLVVCVHIIQLKLLTAIRVSSKQKKIDINIPKLEDFIHKIYIQLARKIYKNVYLFEMNVPPLQVQKNNRELELITKESILNAIRDTIPIEDILRAYMDETFEEEVIEEIKEEKFDEENKEKIKEGKLISENNNSSLSSNLSVSNNNNNNNNNSILETETETQINKETIKEKTNNLSGGLKFNDIDSIHYDNNNTELVKAPKDIETLEKSYKGEMQISDNDDNDDNDDKIVISNENINVDSLGIENLNNANNNDDFILEDIEILT